jgi:regulator of sirC expression with transglutaminase-like and TPR domain
MLMMDFPLARQRFYQETSQPEAQIDLAKAALYIAQEEYPELDLAANLEILDGMADDLRIRLQKPYYPMRVIKTINQYLYEEKGFSGNSEHYYDPRNSFLNEVLQRRTGIPITLALVYAEVGKRVDFPTVGINMPGHFLLQPEFEDAGIYIDAFHGGEVLFAEDCAQLLGRIYGESIDVDKVKPMLTQIGKKRFLARILTNLKMIYLTLQDMEKTLAAVERILMLFPDATSENRDRGLLYYQAGRWVEARQDLEIYLDRTPNAQDKAVIQQILDKIAKQS